MAVAAVSHDSASWSERPGKNKALRGQKTVTEGGQRPGVLQDLKAQVAVDPTGLLLGCWTPSVVLPRLDDNGPENAVIAFFLARTAEHLFLEEEEGRGEGRLATLHHFDPAVVECGARRRGRCEAGQAQDHRQSSL